jgi:hypothetical protein
MALALDGSASGQATGAASVASAGLTTGTAGDIIVAYVFAEWITGTGAAGTISGISGGGLTWHNRGSQTANLTGALGAWTREEIWWAYSSGTLSSSAITATFSLPSSTNFDDASIIVFGVKGFLGTAYQTAPWDSNVSLPKFNSSSASAAPSVSGISTTSANTMLLTMYGTSGSSALMNAGPAGFTYLKGQSNTGGSNDASVESAYQVVSATQSSITETWGTAIVDWASAADALAQGSAGGGVISMPRPRLVYRRIR